MRNKINFTNDATPLPNGTTLATEATMADVANENLNVKEKLAFALLDWLNSTLTSKTNTFEGYEELQTALESIRTIIYLTYNQYKTDHERTLLVEEVKIKNEVNEGRRRVIKKIAADEAFNFAVHIIRIFAQEISKHFQNRGFGEIKQRDMVSFLVDRINVGYDTRDENKSVADDSIARVLKLVRKHASINSVYQTDPDTNTVSRSEDYFDTDTPQEAIDMLLKELKDVHLTDLHENIKLREAGELTFVRGQGMLTPSELAEYRKKKSKRDETES